jgi:TnpA family transposase
MRRYTPHPLQFVSDEGCRRLIGAQLNVTEARHRLTRRIFFGQRGELRQHYHEGTKTSCDTYYYSFRCACHGGGGSGRG